MFQSLNHPGQLGGSLVKEIGVQRLVYQDHAAATRAGDRIRKLL
jgi:hypothetical protein